MNKRILTLLLVFCLVFGSIIPASAATTDDEMYGVLAALGIMNGDENGNLNLTSSVTRAEFAKMLTGASVYGDQGGSTTGVSPFSDVSVSHWAAGYVATARDAGWINGYLDGTYKPNENVTLAEAITSTLKLLGYTDADFTGTWPSGQVALAKNLTLTSGITAGNNDTLTRAECAKLIYNALNTTTKAGVTHATALGYALDASGNIDYLSLMNTAMEGPVVNISGSWEDSISFTPTHFYRNGIESTQSAITDYDLVYYSEKMLTVWAWSNPKTGTIDAISPNTSNPTSVTISGTTYTLGSSAASYAVSNLGSFKVGDGVTALLGREGNVEAIYSASAMDLTVLGMVTETGVTSYTSSVGNNYTMDYISIIATDGSARQFALSSEYNADAGDVVTISVTDGKTTVKGSTSTSVSGTVSGYNIGSYSFAANAEILDVADENCTTIAVSRLNGVSLTSSDIKGVSFNSNGEIDQMVLNNVTGDAYSYGVLDDKDRYSTGTISFLINYQYQVSGVSYFYSSTNEDFGGSEGPVQIQGSLYAPEKMVVLESGTISELNISTATVAGINFDLTAGVQVYEKRNSNYYLVPISEVNTSDYTLKGWYDKEEQDGGKLRIITATAK